MEHKFVYTFGDRKAEGNSSMKNLLGGKGANLAEMSNKQIPVPPGFTITTEVCTYFTEKGPVATRELINDAVRAAVAQVEGIMGSRFGDVENPCLFSVRSGARKSMPGMMDTVLNLGLNDEVVEGLARKSNNPRFAWDSYRRFIQMYGGVVLRVGPEHDYDRDPFEQILEAVKEEHHAEFDTQLGVEELQEVVARYKKLVEKQTGRPFPSDPWEQLWGSVNAVFSSWNNERAILYRQLNHIPSNWGTAVNVQAMVYGNMGDSSATGVCFTRNSSTGANEFNGEYLLNAQGEDVVAGVRTPQQIVKQHSLEWAEFAGITEEERLQRFASLEELMPVAFAELVKVETLLERHYRNMQDIEFTIQEGKLWILQTRDGKRTGHAMIKIALDMLNEHMIDEREALMRIEPEKIDELLHPEFNKKALKNATRIAKGLAASPGAAIGQIVFTAADAEGWKAEGKKTILVRTETSPEDLKGMNAAEGILTSQGGMTSHAAIVARGMGKCCIVGASHLRINYMDRTMVVGENVYREGDWISLNGSTGEILEGKVALSATLDNKSYEPILKIADKYTRMSVRTNADTPHDARVAREFGAKGIGLCRTEHMFFEGDRIKAVREMILAKDEAGRQKALEKILPMQRSDFEGIFEAMAGLPVTIRLLDPPLHEFLPHEPEAQADMAHEMGVSVEEVKRKVVSLAEINPMLGHRGCRLGNTYPEITRMQTRAIIEAALNLKERGIEAKPEIMVPLVGHINEFKMQEKIIRKTAASVFVERGDTINFLVGTMIEVPRAALTADEIAKHAEFFSFGTNDLTQMGFGFSRDDIAKFLPVYIAKNLLEEDPFQVLDQRGIGKLMEMGTKFGRSSRPSLKVGLCGEHGGEPSSVEFCHNIGLDYVSCSPYRVLTARVAAAQAAVKSLMI